MSSDTGAKNSGWSWQKKMAVAGTCGVACVAVTPVALGLAGFGASGIAANSSAAWLMSCWGGSVPAGGLVATLQSAGAAGAGLIKVKCAAGALGSVAGGVINYAMGRGGDCTACPHCGDCLSHGDGGHDGGDEGRSKCTLKKPANSEEHVHNDQKPLGNDRDWPSNPPSYEDAMTGRQRRNESSTASEGDDKSQKSKPVLICRHCGDVVDVTKSSKTA